MLRRLGKKENRTSKRLPVYHLAKYRHLSDPAQPMVLFTVKDISEGGMRCCVDHLIPQGSVIEIQVQFPFLDSPESCSATVIWARKMNLKSERYEIGLKFRGVNDFLTRALAKRRKEDQT